MLEADRQALLTLIHNGFKDTPAPKNGFVGYDLDDFANKHWRDITPEIVRKYRDEFISFSPEGFRFYLPAILTAIIAHPKVADTAVDNIIRYLSPPEPDDIYKPYFELRFPQFSNDEKKVVAEFLKSYRKLAPYGAWTFNEVDGMALDRAIYHWNIHLWSK